METRIFRRTCTVMVLLAGMLSAQDAVVAGTYKGQWNGAAASGDIHITFRNGGDGKLTPEVGFTLGGQDVTCKVLSFKTDGANLTLVYEFDAEGNILRSATEATVRGKTIEGTYKTTAGDQAVDSGTWKATAP
jgi:opacity protein-like surface antigen